LIRQIMTPDIQNSIPLGNKVSHSPNYDPEHLFPVPRSEGRREIGIGAALPFIGTDTWNAYEVSWLDPKGKPEVVIGRFDFPCGTKNLIESKSLKLYLNSLNLSAFNSPKEVKEIIEKDLCRVANGKVDVAFFSAAQFQQMPLSTPPGRCLDDLEVAIDQYNVAPETLLTTAEPLEESLFSNLLRTNCPITGQPDWATVVIGYSGRRIDPEGLLKYIVSYRDHTGFHENCVERIFTDISARCTPDKLFVQARFTRRGGLDINPWRANYDAAPDHSRYARQ
jgi:7-cyano-7-deazaguanine reductase